MRSFELVAEGKLTPQVQALDQSARKCVEADIGAAFARRSVGVRLEHNHPEWHVEFATLIARWHSCSRISYCDEDRHEDTGQGGRDDRQGPW